MKETFYSTMNILCNFVFIHFDVWLLYK